MFLTEKKKKCRILFFYTFIRQMHILHYTLSCCHKSFGRKWVISLFPWNMFPFNNDMSKLFQQMNPQDMEKNIQNMIAQFMPKEWQGMFDHNDMLSRAASIFPQNSQQSNNPSPPNLQANVFETFDDVYVRIPIEEEMVQKIKIFHTSNQLIIENSTDGNRETITLPALVKKKGTAAQYKDGILEVKMPKSVDLQYTEIDVSERL